MTTFLPWTNDVSNSTRSLINYIRHYSDQSGKSYKQVSEEVYLFNNPNTVKECELCGNTKQYKNFVVGYFCFNKCCIKHRTAIACHSGDQKTAIAYTKYINDNKDFYVENLHNTNVTDPFHKRNTGNITLNAFIAKMIGSPTDSTFYRLVNCPYCNKEFKQKYLTKTPNTYCGGRECRSYLNCYSHNDLIRVRHVVNSFIQGVVKNSNSKLSLLEFIQNFNFDVFKSKTIFKKFLKIRCNQIEDLTLKLNSMVLYENHKTINRLSFVETNGIVFVSTSKNKHTHFKNWLNNCSSDELDTLHTNSNYFSSCDVCGKINQHTEFFTNNKLSRFCSVSCYHISLTNTKKFHPNLYQTPERKLKQSNIIKSHIESGRFTPCVTNSRCKSRVLITLDSGIIVACRSSWEAVFMLANQKLLYEKTRIAYIHPTKKSAIYITDFTDDTNRIIYEIKPKSEQSSDEYFAKYDAAKKWCVDNQYSYVIIDDDWYIDYFKRESWKEILKQQEFGKLIIKRMSQFIIKKEK